MRRLTNRRGPEFDANWSPDGSRVAYRDSRRGINNNDEIYVVNADGSGRRNLTQSSSNDWGPDWSPDGKLIAFSSDVQLYVMRPDGTHRRRITDVEAEYPSWSPDGRRIAFMSVQPDAFDCISSFWSGSGYVIECQDGWFSKSGGISGSCSSHGGNWRYLYAAST